MVYLNAQNAVLKLSQIVQSKFHVYNKNDLLKIVEKDPNAHCKEARIRKTKGNSFLAFGLQPLTELNNAQLQPLINHEQGLTSSPDCILFIAHPSSENLLVALVELKSQNATQWTKQALGGKVIADYLLGMTSALLDQKVDWNKVYYVGLLFQQTPLFQPLPFQNRIEFGGNTEHTIRLCRYPLSCQLEGNYYKISEIWDAFSKITPVNEE